MCNGNVIASKKINEELLPFIDWYEIWVDLSKEAKNTFKTRVQEQLERCKEHCAKLIEMFSKNNMNLDDYFYPLKENGFFVEIGENFGNCANCCDL